MPPRKKNYSRAIFFYVNGNFSTGKKFSRQHFFILLKNRWRKVNLRQKGAHWSRNPPKSRIPLSLQNNCLSRWSRTPPKSLIPIFLQNNCSSRYPAREILISRIPARSLIPLSCQKKAHSTIAPKKIAYPAIPPTLSETLVENFTLKKYFSAEMAIYQKGSNFYRMTFLLCGENSLQHAFSS